MNIDDFEGWKASRGTQEVMAYLKRRQREFTDALISLCYMAQSTDNMVQATKYASAIEAIDLILDLEFEDLSEEERNNE